VCILTDMNVPQTVTKSDILLLLLYSEGASGKINEPIQGMTRLMKLIFLLNQQSCFKDVFSFVPYKMGPFTSEVYEEMENLKNYPSPQQPFIRAKQDIIDDSYIDPELLKLTDDLSVMDDEISASEINQVFYLSSLGAAIAGDLWKELTPQQRLLIEEVKKLYGNLPLKSLLRNVYRDFPDMTVNSEIKQQLQCS
jgi:uncharacterized protein